MVERINCSLSRVLPKTNVAVLEIEKYVDQLGFVILWRITCQCSTELVVIRLRKSEFRISSSKIHWRKRDYYFGMYQCYQRIKITESEVLSFPCCISTFRNYALSFRSVFEMHWQRRGQSKQTVNEFREDESSMARKPLQFQLALIAGLYFTAASACVICTFASLLSQRSCWWQRSRRTIDGPLIFLSSNHYFHVIIALVQW